MLKDHRSALHYNQIIKEKESTLSSHHYNTETLFTTTTPTFHADCTNSTEQYSWASALWRSTVAGGAVWYQEVQNDSLNSKETQRVTRRRVVRLSLPSHTIVAYLAKLSHKNHLFSSKLSHINCIISLAIMYCLMTSVRPFILWCGETFQMAIPCLSNQSVSSPRAGLSYTSTSPAPPHSPEQWGGSKLFPTCFILL